MLKYYASLRIQCVGIRNEMLISLREFPPSLTFERKLVINIRRQCSLDPRDAGKNYGSQMIGPICKDHRPYRRRVPHPISLIRTLKPCAKDE